MSRFIILSLLIIPLAVQLADSSWQMAAGSPVGNCQLPADNCQRGCNLPPPPVWPPDGCPHDAPIAPPATPIPPPCIIETRVEGWTEDGTPVTELSIYVDHPEIGPGARTYTKLTRYGSGPWELAYADWEVSCGKDEGPLTWATLQVLNGHAAAGLAIYQPPLPDWYAALLVELGGPSHLYLPLIIRSRVRSGEMRVASKE